MSQSEHLGGQRIVWVDDDPGMLLILAHHLRGNLGAEVVCLGSGEEALAWLQGNPAPDLLLFDYQMPGVDGRDLCRAARADPKLARVPIVLLSGEKISAEEVQQLGANEALLKPCPPSTLVPVLRTYLRSGRPLAQEMREVKRNYARQLLREAERVEELRRALANGEKTTSDELKKLLHRLGGTAGTYGFMQVAETSARIGRKLGAGLDDDVSGELAGLVAQLMEIGLAALAA